MTRATSRADELRILMSLLSGFALEPENEVRAAAAGP